jgi:urea transporter
MHANGKYMDKMYYHTIDSGLYSFDEVFAEKKMGSTFQVCGVIAAVAGGVWFVIVAIRRK